MTLNQHAERFHAILVSHGLRKPTSTALDHDLAERERRPVRPLDTPAPESRDPLALRHGPQAAPGSTIAPEPTKSHAPTPALPAAQPLPSPDTDWNLIRKDLA